MLNFSCNLRRMITDNDDYLPAMELQLKKHEQQGEGLGKY